MVKKRLSGGGSFAPLEAFSTDFTQLNYRNGKAHLMAVVCIETRYVAGWAVGRRANRKLALRCWKRVKERLAELGTEPARCIVHHDQDSVYTSHDWLRKLLARGTKRRSATPKTAQKTTRGSSRSGAAPETENESLIAEAESTTGLTEIVSDGFDYYNSGRRHSALQYEPPLTYLRHRIEREDISREP